MAGGNSTEFYRVKHVLQYLTDMPKVKSKHDLVKITALF